MAIQKLSETIGEIVVINPATDQVASYFQHLKMHYATENRY